MANDWGNDDPVVAAPVADWGGGDAVVGASSYSPAAIATRKQDVVAAIAKRRQLREEADAAALVPKVFVGINAPFSDNRLATFQVPEELAAFGAEAIKSSPSTAAGVAAASAATPGANRLAALLSPVPIAGTAARLGVPLVAGGAAALATRFAQEEVLPQILPEGAERLYRDSAELAARNPNAALLGQVAGAAPFFRPGLPIGSEGSARLAVPLVTGGIGAGIEGANQIAQGDLDVQRLALAAGGSALMNRETALGARIGPNLVLPNVTTRAVPSELDVVGRLMREPITSTEVPAEFALINEARAHAHAKAEQEAQAANLAREGVVREGIIDQQKVRALAERMAGKTPEDQLSILDQELKLQKDTLNEAEQRAGMEMKIALKQQIEQQGALEKAAADQQKAVADAQKAQEEATTALTEAAKPPEIPKSAQILAEGSKPPPLANVATEIGTQTSPFALQTKINEMTGTPPAGAAPSMTEPALALPQIAGPETPVAPPRPKKGTVAPAEYKGFREGVGKIKGFDLYNLTADIPGHNKGSTVAGETLVKEGFALPEKGVVATPEVASAAYSLKAPKPLIESLGSVQEALAYRQERIDNYRKVLKSEIGLDDVQTDRLVSLLKRDADTARFERTLTPEQREKFEVFFDGPLNQKNGPLDDWSEGVSNPAELATATDKAVLADVIVGSLGRVGNAPEFVASDVFLSPVVALHRLNEIGGSWRDVDTAIKNKLGRMRAGDDSAELYGAYGRSIKGFADKHGLVLPLEPASQLTTSTPAAPVETVNAPQSVERPMDIPPAQMKRADRVAELKERGVTEINGTPIEDAPPNQQIAALGRLRNQRGAIPASVLAPAGGSALGGAAGYVTAPEQQPGESDEDYQARALTRAAAGAALGAGAGALGSMSRGARARIKATPAASKPGAPPRITKPEPGDGQGIRHLAERVIDDKARTPTLRQSLADNPEIIYDKFLLGDLADRVAAATPQELATMRASLDRNEKAAATIELANRADAEGRDVEAADLYAEASTLFTNSAQLLNVAKLVRSPVAISTAVKDELKGLGRTTTVDQDKQLNGLSKGLIDAERDLAKAEREAMQDFSPANQSAFERARSAANVAQKKLTEFVGQITPKDTADLIIQIIQGNLLTPLSQIANVYGNILFQPVRRGAMSIASGIDAIYSGLTGEARTIDRANPLPRAAELEAFGDGVKIAAKELLTGPGSESYVKGEVQRGFRPIRSLVQAFTGRNMARNAEGEIPMSDRAKKFIEGTAGVPPEIMFRLLNLGDRGFRRAAEIETLLEQARLRGLKGRELEKFLEFPDKATQALLNTEARKAIFAQENAGLNQLNHFLDSGIAKLLHLDQIPAAKGAIKIFGRLNVPFRQFPVNYVMTALNFAVPELAMAKGLFHSVNGDRRKALTNIGEGIMGMTMYGAAAYLWKHGLISEPVDRDAKQRSIQYDNMGGQRINLSGLSRSLARESPDWRRDDTTVDWGRMGIPAPVFYVYTQYKNKGTKTLRQTGVATPDDTSVTGQIADRVASYPGIGQFALDQSFLAGSSAFLEALKNGFTGPEADAWTANMFRAASTLAVPNTVEALARAEYQYIPELRGDTLGDTLKNMWDFKTFQLPKDDRALLKRDIWGEPISRTPPNQNPYVYQFLDVTKAQERDADPFKAALVRTFNESDNPNTYPSIPDRNFTVGGITVKLEPKDYETLQAITGKLRRQEAEPMVVDPEFQSIPAGERVAELEKVYALASADARNTLLADEGFQSRYPALFGANTNERVVRRDTAARNRLETLEFGQDDAPAPR